MENTLDIHSKIKEVIHGLHLNNSSFAKKVGVTSTTIDSITSGRLQGDGSRKKTKPGYDLLLSIIESCNINPNYFFGQTDQMFLTSSQENLMSPPVLGLPKIISVDPSGDENIIYVPSKARAGYLNGYDDEEYIETLPAFKMPFLTNNTYRCFEIKGNSMARTLYDGDLVFGRYVDSFDDIKDGRIYVIVSKNDGIVIKRVINRSQESGKLILKSDNVDGNFPTYTMEIEDVEEVWYVSMYASKQMPEPIDIYERLTQLESKLIELESKSTYSKN